MAAIQNGDAHSYHAASKIENIRQCFRIVKAIAVLLTLTGSASIVLIFFSPFTFYFIRFFSVRWSRRLNSFIFGRWLSMWPFFFEVINGTQVIFTGDKLPSAERAIVMCNHRTEIDWMYIWDLAIRKNRVGCIKYVVKSSVKNAPIFGWAFHVLEFLLIDRRWEADELVFKSMLSSFKGFQDDLWLVIFPEGTDYSEEKCEKSRKYAEEKGLPMLDHVLMPRTKGVCVCLEQLRDSVDAVYDLTIGYDTKCPLFMDNALGTEPKKVYIHVKRIPISDIPVTNAGVSDWLVTEFVRKDGLLSHFYKNGAFCDDVSSEKELSLLSGLLNCCLIIGVCFAFLLFFFSFPLVRAYVASSCVLLAVSTFVNYKPLPVFNSHCQKALNRENGTKHH
ncbi:hypothetical protein KP509_32G074300 [Ceratopteris richardii]|uniref:1-acylglycerol-3-phosphate O-acyltransferase n=1 Tax=Ceratopteris richardii TaxID=49495 RepID=A0A8T2QUX5_CERRI|nr:hypothetical protein KP509_32G074300 [Ceratopteris richardii]